MLEISKIESGLAQMQMEHISLTDLVEAVAQKTSLLLDEYQLDIQLSTKIEIAL